jgi:NAD(P)-dependent dehydrogenase (short-subunit alcohol dehydrogenase family)
MNIKGATVLVTGANRGIGRALLENLTGQGVAKIYAATRKPDELTNLAGDLIVPVKLDITDRASVKALAEKLDDITILINNAGALAFGSLLDAPLEMITRDFDTNFYGTLHMARAFAPVIERNGGGAIVNLLSLVALASFPGMGGYSASKAAAFSLTQAIRTDLKGKNISVHGVYPGAVDTDMLAGVDMPKSNPSDIAAAVVAGVLVGTEDIFPDAMSQQMSQVWLQNPKQLESTFVSMAL